MCVKTLSAWNIGKKPNGKSILVFTPPARGKGEFIQLPCGQCMDCRLERSRVWALRCMQEASLHENNCFITLTFNDDNLDPILSLQKHHFRNFIKRLRIFLTRNTWNPEKNQYEKIDPSHSDAVRQPTGVRYFHAGEYGDQFGRPHHHAILFGYDFPDKIHKVSRRGFNYYESALLTQLWSDPKTKESYGFHEITSVSFETCAYVARYVCKKINGKNSDDHYSIVDEQGNCYVREKEFLTMSRNPGIAAAWYEKYKYTDVWAHDKIHVKGNIYSTPPRYYGNKYELDNPEHYAKLKKDRVDKAKANPGNSWDAQKSREANTQARYSMLKRTIK